ncbi:MAG: DUF6279 family lipoprotein [Burkholderiaceae bacterium]
MNLVRALRYGIVLGVALALSGCGAVKLAYEDGETFTLFWAARYISLDHEQETFARNRVRAWFDWHRTTQLPGYARLGAEIQSQVRGPVALADIDRLESNVRAQWHQMVDAALPALADLALMLHDDQLVRLEKKFAANDDTYRSDYVEVSPSQRKKDLYNRELDRVEYWYGSLSSEQKQLLRKTTDNLPIDPVLWLTERQTREQELVALLHQIIEQKPAREKVVQMLHDYALRVETSPDPARRAYIEALDRSRRQMYVTVANMATPDQRAHAVSKLQDWIDEFTGLSQS